MKKSVWKSIGAIFAGFIAGSIITVIADLAMQSSGLIDMEKFKESSTSAVLIVTIYRFIFSVIACYITAWLAPVKPMKHAIILGSIGFILSLLGAILMWNEAVAWYNLAVILMALPCAWIGAKLYVMRNPEKETNI